MIARDRKKVICLHGNDNVLVCIDPIKAGEMIQLEEQHFFVSCDISVGHKISRVDIGEGEKIIKYGVPIGSARCRINTGEHVHTHNIQSDYIHTYTRNADKGSK